MPTPRPLVGIPADRRLLDGQAFHAVGERYLTALADAGDVLPLLVPSLGREALLDEVVARLDGLFLPGSRSNIEPWRYGGEPARPGSPDDPQRDATTLPLVARALAAGVPVLAVCRGFQEMNVALGGTLWQHVEEVPGLHPHHADPTQPLAVQYAPRHEVVLAEGGLLRGLAGRERVRVNSLHHQGVRTLAPGLVVEAHADDGLVEGFRVQAAQRLAVGVQWHPEWGVPGDPFAVRLFEAFAAAARDRAAARGL